MAQFRHLAVIAAAAVIGAPAIPSSPIGASTPDPAAWPTEGSELSVMTYNVKGLPWPIASGRPVAFVAIGQRLRLMRARGVQPRIVVLQESFTDDAKRLGELAGYRHRAFGARVAGTSPSAPLGTRFAAAGQTLKGEGLGAVLDSGLTILSDYPIVRTASMAFPEGACAGFDCLAAKGVLVAWIRLPGSSVPVAVVNTHLNSGRAAMVETSRSNAAHVWQVGAVRAFLSRTIAPDTPVIFGGDFNVGTYPERNAAMAEPVIGQGQRDDLSTAASSNLVPKSAQAEVKAILKKNLDKIFSRSGPDLALSPARAWVPFGLATTSNPLSDHAGFVVEYSYRGEQDRMANGTMLPARSVSVPSTGG